MTASLRRARRPFIGRSTECDALARLLGSVRGGESATVVLRGDPGVGKTALLDHIISAAPDFQVARVVGVESERELPFAALHQLCGRMLDRVDRLPAPQRDALGVAFGLADGGRPDRFLTGLAVLNLLADVAASAPLLCVVDDAQWLDTVSAQTLAFVARRLHAESVALVFATRTGAAAELDGLPEIIVGGLVDDDAAELLATVLPGRLDERVRDRIVAETRGNPLALLELPNGVPPGDLAGGFGLNRTLPLSGQIEDSFQRRVGALPAATRQLLLIAAAEPLGDPALLWSAAARLTIRPEASAAAEAAGLVEIGSLVRFRHPLVRSAVYHAASAVDRRRVHAALAEATDSVVDPDRRAWHRAEAAAEPDEAVAVELERCAGRALARGGLAAAAAFLERSASLTPEPARRAERERAAAQQKFAAGSPLAASMLLARAEAGQLEALPRALLERLRAQIEFTLRRGSAAPPLFLRAAKMLEPLDARLARDTYLEAIDAALYAGRFGSGGGVVGVAVAARDAPHPPGPPRVVDLLLDGLAAIYTAGYATAVPALKQAQEALGAEERDLGCIGHACHAAGLLWDLDRRHRLAALQVQLARDAGALAVLPFALNLLASVQLMRGNLAAAESLLEESDAITEATGNAPLVHIWLMLAAWRGQEPQVPALCEASIRDATARGEGNAIAVAEHAAALFHNGRGEHRTALSVVNHERALDEMFGTWGLPEVVEAAARGGERKLAIAAVERLGEQTASAGSDWAVGMEARSRALVSDGAAAEGLYRTAIDRLGSAAAAAHLARAHLLFGEWLRRQRRRVEAREHLRTAHQTFLSMGADGFAERASRSLLATGEHARRRAAESVGQLTSQEAQVARLARDGHTNAEISAQLFISPRTVEYHLRKVFSKLGINSRTKLDSVLPL